MNRAIKKLRMEFQDKKTKLRKRNDLQTKLNKVELSLLELKEQKKILTKELQVLNV